MDIKDDPILRHFPTMLRRWDGCVARLWELTISHACLTIRIEETGRAGNLEISGGPIYIAAPRQWENCKIQVSRDENDNFVITDEEASVRIVTEDLGIAENRKPLNAFTSPTGSW